MLRIIDRRVVPFPFPFAIPMPIPIPFRSILNLISMSSLTQCSCFNPPV